MKALMTLTDLVRFCEENKLYEFDSSKVEKNTKIFVQIPSTYESIEDRSDELALFGKIKLMHTNRNRNGSNALKKGTEMAAKKLAYKPLLANFCEIDGEFDFTSHDIEIDEDGNSEYIERQIGCFTADKPYMKYDEEKDRHYLYAYVAIPRVYTKAAEIIERKGGTKVSAELMINKMSYDAKNKELLLEEFEIMGATCLGKNPDTGEDVQEGMEGARIDIEDFSRSLKYEQNNELIKVIQELKESLDNYTKTVSVPNSEEGGKDMTKFEELLEKYSVAADDIEFDYENMSDEELEAKFEELFGEVEDENEDGIEENFADGEDDNDDADDENDIDAQDLDDEDEGSEDPEKAASNDDDAEWLKKHGVKYSVEMGESVKEFSVSLSEVIYALQSLVNDTYGESDNDWYCVDVFADDKCVVMHGWSHSYRQAYKVRNDQYTLVGDRVEVFAQYLTNDEIKKLDEMRSNYSLISDKLAKYESEPKKLEILNSDDYSKISEVDEFKALMKQENHFDLSVDEVRNEADAILLSYAKKGNLDFSAQSKKEISKKALPFKAKNSRYGNLFAQK